MAHGRHDEPESQGIEGNHEADDRLAEAHNVLTVCVGQAREEVN